MLYCLARPLSVGVFCVSVLVVVPADMSHRIAVVDRDLEAMHRRPDRYGLGADWGYAPAQYLSRKLHGCPCGYAGDPEKECTCSPT